jgi:hypothetical protein
MMENWISQDFMPRLRNGEFDDHLAETMASLTIEQLTEVAHALQEEADIKLFTIH